MLNEPLKMAKVFNCVPNCRKFAKSGYTEGNASLQIFPTIKKSRPFNHFLILNDAAFCPLICMETVLNELE